MRLYVAYQPHYIKQNCKEQNNNMKELYHRRLLLANTKNEWRNGEGCSSNSLPKKEEMTMSSMWRCYPGAKLKEEEEKSYESDVVYLQQC
jgi:hypothetical protein